MWADIANSILEKTGDEGRAIRGANSQVDIDIGRASKKGPSGSNSPDPSVEV